MRGVLLVNPGSPTFPRNLTRRLGTVGFLEIDGRMYARGSTSWNREGDA